MFLGSLYCKQYRPRSDSDQASYCLLTCSALEYATNLIADDISGPKNSGGGGGGGERGGGLKVEFLSSYLESYMHLKATLPHPLPIPSKKPKYIINYAFTINSHQIVIFLYLFNFYHYYMYSNRKWPCACICDENQSIMNQLILIFWLLLTLDRWQSKMFLTID